jgi:hypothetical protein
LESWVHATAFFFLLFGSRQDVQGWMMVKTMMRSDVPLLSIVIWVETHWKSQAVNFFPRFFRKRAPGWKEGIATWSDDWVLMQDG